jgi:hypothetical protein
MVHVTDRFLRHVPLAARPWLVRKRKRQQRHHVPGHGRGARRALRHGRRLGRKRHGGGGGERYTRGISTFTGGGHARETDIVRIFLIFSPFVPRVYSLCSRCCQPALSARGVHGLCAHVPTTIATTTIETRVTLSLVRTVHQPTTATASFGFDDPAVWADTSSRLGCLASLGYGAVHVIESS